MNAYNCIIAEIIADFTSDKKIGNPETNNSKKTR